MYQPPLFTILEYPAMQDAMDRCGLAHFVTRSGADIVSSELPLLLRRDEGEKGVLYGHLAKANPQWCEPVEGEALAIFLSQSAYITPSWYETKSKTGKVVPTWNYEVVHAYGIPEFFQDEDRLIDLVTRLTERHENARRLPWSVDDAPSDYILGQLRGIVGFRMPIDRLQGKLKMSQNRPASDRRGVVAGLREEGQDDIADRIPLS